MADEKTNDNALEENIRELLEQARTQLQADGGDLEIVSIEGKKVTLNLKGHCAGCPHAQATLKGYIEEALRTYVDPEITVERGL